MKSKNICTDYFSNTDQDLVDSLNESDDFDTVNIFCAQEFEVFYKWKGRESYKLLEKLIRNGVTVNILFNGFNTEKHKSYVDVPPGTILHYWPEYLLYHSFIIAKESPFPKPKKIKKIFLSYNRAPHNHRCLLMDLLAKRNLLKEGKCSWLHPHPNYEFKYWKQEKLTLDIKRPKDRAFQWLGRPIELSNTFVQLVPETSIEIQSLTEKTYLQILFKRPFLIFGASGIHRKLSELGFEMYDEIFDYSFDEIEDLEERGEKLLDNLENLKGKNLNKLRKKLLPKIERNFNNAMKIINSWNNVPEILKNYYNTNETVRIYEHVFKHLNGVQK
jgi:hypothetical protein